MTRGYFSRGGKAVRVEKKKKKVEEKDVGITATLGATELSASKLTDLCFQVSSTAEHQHNLKERC